MVVLRSSVPRQVEDLLLSLDGEGLVTPGTPEFQCRRKVVPRHSLRVLPFFSVLETQAPRRDENPEVDTTIVRLGQRSTLITPIYQTKKVVIYYYGY